MAKLRQRLHVRGFVFILVLLTAVYYRPAVSPAAAAAVALPIKISPYNRDLCYVGRFDRSLPAGPRCAWSASSVTLKFNGTAAQADLSGGTNDRWQVIVDGRPTRVLTMRGGPHTFPLASHLAAGVHTITLFKLGEPIWGTTEIDGFDLAGGSQILPIAQDTRHLEVIGDSISAGYGDQAPNQTYHFSAKTENAYLAYGAVAARALNAEYVCIAWSGKCLWPKNTIPKIYGRVLPQIAASRWNFSWHPQAIVINLGTNDFAGGDPPEKGWVNAYVRFIARLRRHDKDVTIFCALSPMLSNTWSFSKNARSKCRKYIQTVVHQCNQKGYHKVYFLDFPMQTGKYGFGADWHPSVGEHRYMAEILERALREKLGW